MDKHNSSMKEVLKHFGKKRIAAALAAVIIAATVIIFISRALSSVVRDNIWVTCQLNAIQSSEEFDIYLTMGTNAVKLAAHTVDRLLQDKASHREILDFMTEETVNIQATVFSEFTGLYGWIDREYLDGAGWVPDPDYIPTQRPWYVEAIDKEEDVVYIKPYLDLDTGTVMMTVSCRLSDGESILALDIPLHRLQEITEQTAAQNRGSISMVLDDTGGVVAHSDVTQVGCEYLQETGTLGNMIAGKVIEEGQTQFEITFEGKNYLIYSRQIEGGWYSVSVNDADMFFSNIKMIRVATIIILVITIILIIIEFLRISRRELMMRSLNIELSTIADIYESVYDIDLEDNTYREISSRAGISNAVSGDHNNVQERMHNALEKLADERTKHVILEFTDFSSLDERLAGQVSITEEFLDKNGKWCRARFIASERNDDGKLTHVLWLVESIDLEKRRNEELLRLSETDRMTGLLNRVSGETRVSNMLGERGGMFMMLDVDNFKSINDTFGHNVGDEVLITIANALKSALRSEDIIMRLGGDEFALYAPGVHTEEIGNKIIARFSDALRNNRIKALGDFGLGVSIGAAFCGEDDEITFKELYERADNCMYQSKRNDSIIVTYYE